MEKEFLKEKGESLPIPALQQQASEDAARAAIASTRRRRAFRFLAAAGLMVLLGSTAFSYFHRSLERQRGLSDLPDRRGRLTVSEVEEHFLSIPDSESAIATSKQYATLPHLAGSDQDFETAKDFLSLLQTELGIRAPKDLPVYDAGSPESQSATHGIVKRFHRSAWIDKYYPVMNTPLDRALEVVDDDDSVVWKADVDETPDPKDPASEHTFEVGAWHGLSAAGDVTGPAVYVNYGRKKDYDELAAAGVNLTGTIAIARYGGVFRGLKIKAAQEAGCIGALIYTDPRDHGTVTEEAGYLPYPHGPAVNPNSVQRGSVQYLSSYPGDPTTPGEPSYPNATRTEGGNIPKIPSLPVSWNNGLHILKEINPASPFTMDGTFSKRRIRLQNLVDTRVMPIWNTMGVIPGHIRDEVVVLGNHRDAWVMGAADPTSGTVTMVEIVKGLGHLLRKGWRPLRTIVIASWDAEEYGLIGSTEWGEDFADFLKEHVVAYLNVDVSVSGSRFNIGGSPSLAHLIRGVAQSLAHPTEANRTLWDARDDRGPFKGIAGSVGAQAEVGEDFRMAEELRASMDADELSTGVHPLGSGSDYTVFLQRIGIAAIDGGFGATLSDAVYHYHSVYDSQQFQEQYADPGFLRHVAVAKYLGLVTLRVADSIILPLNTTQYALELGSYLAKVEKLATENSLSTDFSSLHHAISKLAKSSYALDEAKDKAEKEFRKALSKIRLPHRDGMSRSTRAARRAGCTKRTWAKFRNWVKARFGVHEPVHETEHTNVHPHPHHPHPHHHEEPVPEVKFVEVPSNIEDTPFVLVDDADHTHDKRDDDLEERGSAVVQKVRVGLAGAKWKRNRDHMRDSPRSSSRPSRPCARHGRHSGSIVRDVWDLAREADNHHEHHHPSSSSSSWIPKIPHFPRRGSLRKLIKAARAVRKVNAKLSSFEGGFISEGGIKDREWYRHLGVAPGKWLGYGATTFPALTEALDEKNSTLAAQETERLTALIEDLAQFLKL